MSQISFKYGHSSISFDYTEANFDVLSSREIPRPLSDPEIGERLEDPIGSKSLDELINVDETVLIVVPDATRQTACGQIVNLVVRRLISNGTTPDKISVIFATGIHRKVTETEKNEILTPFVAQRIKTIDHDAKDLAALVNLGETSGGIPIFLNRALVENDHVILIGGISFHYFAGFTGGRKLVCPGLAGSRTIKETHRIAFDCESRSRRDGVGTGLLSGNAVHEVFVEAVSVIKPTFAINAIVDGNGIATEIFAGDWQSSHLAACEAFAAANTVQILEKRDLVIVSCGGSPHDINMIQAHKALEAATNACAPGGEIVLIAECRDGLGKDDFLKWFEFENSKELAAALCEKYVVNGQTAWNLMQRTEQFRVSMITELSTEMVAKMGMRKIADLNDYSARCGYLIPFGAKIMVSI